MTLTVPRLRTLPFDTQIIERYRRRLSSVEEALVEMYLAGVSTRRVEDITEALWGTRVSASTVSELNQRVYARIDAWRDRPLAGDYPYLFVDGIWLKRTWGGEVRNVAVLVAVGIAASGRRDILAVQEGAKLDGLRLGTAARVLRAGVGETLAYLGFPRGHWRRIRTNNLLERLMKEVWRRTRVVGAFPDGRSAVMLAAARLRHVAGTGWSDRAYLYMRLLRDHDREREAMGPPGGGGRGLTAVRPARRRPPFSSRPHARGKPMCAT